MTDMNPKEGLAKLRELHDHLAKANDLAEELKPYLPLAAAGRGFIEWEMLTWMKDVTGNMVAGEEAYQKGEAEHEDR